MKIGIVVATYEWPEALAAVLRGFADQSDRGFELVVADDGSGPETEAVAREFDVGHVRQEDDGYRLARVRNLGAQVVGGDYLVFLDGDAIPRRGFVRALRQAAALPGWFLAGKRLELGPELSRARAGGRARPALADRALGAAPRPGAAVERADRT